MKKIYRGLDCSGFKLIITSDSTVVDEKNRCVAHTVGWKLNVPSVFRDMLFDARNDDEYYINGRAKGVAICHKEDQFDPEVGKKLARAIAESNAYVNASKRMRKYVKHLKDIIDAVDVFAVNFRIKAEDIRVHNEEYMNKLVGKK